MSPITITLPSHWWLLKPCGCVDGSMVSVRFDGSINAASSEAAWEKFTPLARTREKEARQGYVCRGITDDEQSRFVELLTAKCTHGAVS